MDMPKFHYISHYYAIYIQWLYKIGHKFKISRQGIALILLEHRK